MGLNQLMQGAGLNQLRRGVGLNQLRRRRGFEPAEAWRGSKPAEASDTSGRTLTPQIRLGLSDLDILDPSRPAVGFRPG